jgi:hypothetical protein
MHTINHGLLHGHVQALPSVEGSTKDFCQVCGGDEEGKL